MVITLCSCGSCDEHDFSSHLSRIKKEPTCTAEGIGINKCINCDYQEEYTIPTIKHSYISATCLQAKYCSNCGIVEGEKLDHNWQDATCTQAKICGFCGETEGVALGHKYNYGKCQYCLNIKPGYVEPKISENGLESELKQKFGSVNIGFDVWQLDYQVIKNDHSAIAYDYRIYTKWSSRNTSFIDLQEYDLTYSADQKEAAKNALKEKQKEIYEYVSSKYPSQKFEGGYHESSINKYTLQFEFRIEFYSWKNHDGTFLSGYHGAKVSNFQWNTFNDTHFN